MHILLADSIIGVIVRFQKIKIFQFLKNDTPHSRYFSDELGVPNFLLKPEQMFVIQRDVLYNTNMEKDIFTIKEKALSYARWYLYSLQYHLVWCTNYRKQLLKNGIDAECKKMMYELAEVSVEFIVLCSYRK